VRGRHQLGLVRQTFYICGVLASLFPLLALPLLLLAVSPAVAGCTDAAAPRVDWRRCLHDGRDLQGVDLSGAVLRDASFSRASLQGVKLAGAEAPEVRFTSADMTGADLSGAVLRGADFTRTVLRGGSLARADLRQARFFRADLRGVDFQGAELAGADLSGALLEGALWVDGQRRCAADSVGACR
jgi:uncharacterized protein YjbI with pentapeptide repeats